MLHPAHRLPLACLLALSVVTTSVAQQAQQKAASPMDDFPNIVAVVNGLTITRAKLGQECLKRYGTVVLDN